MNIIKFDFKGHQVGFNNDGWLNATSIAKNYNKEPTAWLRQLDTLEYLIALAKSLYKTDFVTDFNKIKELDNKSNHSRSLVLNLSKKTGLVKIKGGSPENGGGTWLHPKLAIPFARWLSIEFSVWCDLQIDNLIHKQPVSLDDEKLIKILSYSHPQSWEKCFSDPFYQALSKMTNLPFNNHIGGCPALFGKITSDWVYRIVLPKNVYQSIKDRQEKGDKIHQFLKPDALKAVEEQLKAITVIAKGCIDYKDFEARCFTIFDVEGQRKLILAA